MHPKHTTPLQNKTRYESLESSIWSFETLIGEPICFYWTLLDPCTPYLLEDSCYWTSGLLQVPWSYSVPASALDLKKTAFELLSVLNTRNTWESQHWVEFQSLFGHFVQKLCFLWWWLLLLWLFNKGLLTYSSGLMCCCTLQEEHSKVTEFDVLQWVLSFEVTRARGYGIVKWVEYFDIAQHAHTHAIDVTNTRPVHNVPLLTTKGVHQ